MMTPSILYSNAIEPLYNKLKKSLFTSSSPFALRLVAVPTLEFKGWLIRRLAEDEEIGICAGVDIQSLEQAMGKIAALVGNQPKNGYEPTPLQLSLALEHTLHLLLEEEHDRSEWKHLIESLGANPKKIRFLAHALAPIFKEYGRVGPAVFEGIGREEEWQRLLWERVESIFAVWNYPQRKFALDKIQAPNDLQIHLFAVNLLTPLQHRYLNHISQTIPVHYYVLSPCEKFWGDLLSDKERSKLKKKLVYQKVKQPLIEELDRYLVDTNPLLANLGKWGRSQIRLLEEIDGELEEQYCLSRSSAEEPRYSSLFTEELLIYTTERPLTLLQALQTDLLLLKNPDQETKLALSASDSSIQIHAVPKPAREVEVVYDLILGILDNHQVQPEEIWVAAPQIGDYLPYIHAVFGAKESQIPYHVVETEASISHPAVSAFLHLLSLSNGRWEASALLHLFEFPSFQRKHHLKSDAIALLKTVIEQGAVRWGRSAKHRQAIYAKNAAQSESDSTGTWELAFNRALEGLVLFDDGLHRFSPMDQISPSLAENLGQLIEIFQELENSLQPLEHGEERTLLDWVKYLKNLYEGHFATRSNDNEKEGKQLIFHALEELRHAAQRQENARFSSESLLFHLKNTFTTQPLHRSENNGRVVRFGSLSHRGPIPGDTLIIMGMVDGAYPKAEPVPSFHLMYGEKMHEELYPRIEIEKYQFLEQLLTVQNRLIVTYPSLTGGSDQEQLCSPLVNDLLEYLDRAYAIDGNKPSHHCLKKHPLLPFHHRYFSTENELLSTSFSYYKAALKYYHAEKKPPPTFLSLAMEIPHTNVPPQKSVITLSDLSAFARHPLKAYFRKGMGIYLETDLENEDEDPIACSPYQKAVLTKQALTSNAENALTRAYQRGELPKTPFTQLDASQISEETLNLKEQLEAHHLDMPKAVSIECDERFLQPTFQDNCWHVPPLKLNSTTLIGRLDHIFPTGLLLFTEDSPQKTLEYWPQIVTYFCLIDTYGLPFKKQVYFAKKGKVSVKNGDHFSSQALLEDYIAYYLQAQQTPSPLLPDWIPAILNGESETINFQDDTDVYLQWINAWDKNLSWETSFSAWRKTAQHLFLAPLIHWYPKVSRCSTF